MRPHSKRITINTDASYNYHYGVAAYAIYIICDQFKITKSGLFKDFPANSTEAESMAIANALYICANTKGLPTTDMIIVNTDSMLAIHGIGNGKGKKPSGKAVARYMSNLRQKTSKKNVLPDFSYRHVKAHNGTPDARSWVNDWCDKEAKRWMRERVEEIKSQKQKDV